MRTAVDQALAAASGIEVLAGVVDGLRPTRGARDATANLRALVTLLDEDPALASRLRTRVRAALGSLRLVHVLLDSGIRSDRGLYDEIVQQLGSRLLPPVYAPQDARTILATVFRRKRDWQWVRAIPAADWAALILHFVEQSDVEGILHDDIRAAILALAQRIGAAGIDEEVSDKLTRVENADSAFLALSASAHAFLADHREGHGSLATFERAAIEARTCRDTILHLRDNKQSFGTSLRLTRMSRRLLQQLERFELLLRIVRPRDVRALASSIAPLLQTLVEGEQAGHGVRRIVGHNIDLVAYQITEHTARKGGKYVADSPRAYFKFLVAALGGGALVAIFAVLKLFLSKLTLPLAAQAFVYGLNYAVCFVLIYLTGAILATKLPAVTASAIALRLDRATSRDEAVGVVADTIVLVWRSQFVSFLGNILCAFPAAILIAYILEHVLFIETASPEKVRALLDANHPWRSGALWFAAIAGVCLFFGGLIQGSVENRIVHKKIRARLEHHPRLAFLGRRRASVAALVTRHLSGVMSNAALGFMLGSAGVIGLILGLPIDIRHIAFSSAHAGVAVLDAPYLVDRQTLITVLLGIVGIGLINFLVSFGLTLTVTLRSRGVSFAWGRALLFSLARRLVTRLPHWFLPLGRYEHVVSNDAHRDPQDPNRES